MANQNVCEMVLDGQALVNTRPTNRAMNRSNWLRSFLMGAIIAIPISLITILVFEWYFFTVVDGLAMSLSPVTETLRRAEGYPQTSLRFRDLEKQHSQGYFAAPFKENHERTGVESLSVAVPLTAYSITAAD
jgi:uncharacterized membrane protein